MGLGSGSTDGLIFGGAVVFDKILCEWLDNLALSSVYYIDFTRVLYMERK